jgi:hypothetical protein
MAVCKRQIGLGNGWRARSGRSRALRFSSMEPAREQGREGRDRRGLSCRGGSPAASMAPCIPPPAARLLVLKEHRPGSGPPHAQPRLPARRQANRRAERVGGSGDLPTALSSTFAMEVRASNVVELLCSSSTHGGWGRRTRATSLVALLRALFDLTFLTNLRFLIFSLKTRWFIRFHRDRFGVEDGRKNRPESILALILGRDVVSDNNASVKWPRFASAGVKYMVAHCIHLIFWRSEF